MVTDRGKSTLKLAQLGLIQGGLSLVRRVVSTRMRDALTLPHPSVTTFWKFTYVVPRLCGVLNPNDIHIAHSLIEDVFDLHENGMLKGFSSRALR